MKPFQVNVSSKYGAPMGRRCDNLQAVGRAHLERVPFVDGDYDHGGAYWGGGRGTLPLYCAWGEADGETLAFYLRAVDRHQALQIVRQKFPDLKLFRR